MELMNVLDFLQESVNFEHDEINKLLDKIKPEDLDREISDTHTVRGRLIHMSGAEYRMANYLYELPNQDFSIPEDADIEVIREAFEKSKKRHIETLRNLKEEDLSKVWVSKASGNSYSYKFLLWHFLEHLATHRGQIAMFIRMRNEE